MLSITELRESCNTYLSMALAPNTNKNYHNAVKAYEEFCQLHSLTTCPPDEQSLCLFATHLAHTTTYSNIKMHMAAIKFASVIAGCILHLESFSRLYYLMRGIKRSQGASGSRPKRHPVSPRLLKSIRLSIGNSSRPYHDKVMLWTALLTAFFGFLRVSEYTASHKTKFDPLTTLLVSDVRLCSNRAKLRIKASKTDPFRQGMTIRIAANNTILCPVAALRAFLAIRPSKQGPLFTFNNNKFLTRADVNRLLKDTTRGKANISSHSLRIGAASTAAAMGCPKWLIQSMGRWTSDCFRRYIRVSDDSISKASRCLARCSIPIGNAFNPH